MNVYVDPGLCLISSFCLVSTVYRSFTTGYWIIPTIYIFLAFYPRFLNPFSLGLSRLLLRLKMASKASIGTNPRLCEPL